MIVRFPIESGCQYRRLTMKLPVKVRVSRKKMAFFFSVAWCRPPETWEDGKGLDMTKRICLTFWQVIWTFIPHQFACRGGGRKSGRVANR